MLPFDLNEILEAKLAEARRENDGMLHASSHLLGSLRHAQLDVAGAPKTAARSLVGDVRLWTGTMWHTQLDEWFKAERVPVIANMDLAPWMPKGWGGTCDYLIFNPEYSAFALIDLKTIKGDGMRWILRDGPKQEHVYQASLYWHAAKKSGLPLIKQIGIFYLPMSETRDSEYPVLPTLVEFEPLPEDKIIPLAEARWAKTEAYLASLPEDRSTWVTPALAPVQERDLVAKFNKTQGVYEAKLVPNWSTAYCEYGNDLCNCRTQGTTKIGHWVNGVYIPREGYERISPPPHP